MTTALAIVGVLATLIWIPLGDMAKDEARSRLGRTPWLLLRLASRLVPKNVRTSIEREWTAELAATVEGMDSLPATRLFKGLRYSLGLLRAAPGFGRSLRDVEERQQPAENAYAYPPFAGLVAGLAATAVAGTLGSLAVNNRLLGGITLVAFIFLAATFLGCSCPRQLWHIATRVLPISVLVFMTYIWRNGFSAIEPADAFYSVVVGSMLVLTCESAVRSMGNSRPVSFCAGVVLLGAIICGPESGFVATLAIAGVGMLRASFSAWATVGLSTAFKQVAVVVSSAALGVFAGLMLATFATVASFGATPSDTDLDSGWVTGLTFMFVIAGASSFAALARRAFPLVGLGPTLGLVSFSVLRTIAISGAMAISLANAMEASARTAVAQALFGAAMGAVAAGIFAPKIRLHRALLLMALAGCSTAAVTLAIHQALVTSGRGLAQAFVVPIFIALSALVQRYVSKQDYRSALTAPLRSTS
jgi:hypothetical protein